MPDFTEFRTVSAQFGIFTPGLQLPVTRVIARLGELFDGAPTVLPLGSDVPAEVPRLILSSADGRRRMQASSSRLDVFITNAESVEGIDLDRSIDLAGRVISSFMEVTRAMVGRTAVVLQRAVAHDRPGFELARHFCKAQWLDGPLKRPEDFELHAQKSYVLAARWNVNSWVRCKTAKLRPSGQSVILVEQDLNTRAEELETQDFKSEDVARFFRDCLPEFESILRLYFPGGDDA